MGSKRIVVRGHMTSLVT